MIHFSGILPRSCRARTILVGLIQKNFNPISNTFRLIPTLFLQNLIYFLRYSLNLYLQKKPWQIGTYRYHVQLRDTILLHSQGKRNPVLLDQHPVTDYVRARYTLHLKSRQDHSSSRSHSSYECTDHWLQLTYCNILATGCCCLGQINVRIICICLLKNEGREISEIINSS